MKLVKGISSGTTALISSQAPPTQESIAEILDPVRGVSADLFVSLGSTIRVFTRQEEITPPSAVLRLAASHLRSQTSADQWSFLVEGHDVGVSFSEGDYLINHGEWAITAGEGARSQGHDITVEFAGLDDPRPGLRVDVGHRTVGVVAVNGSGELAQLGFNPAPTSDPQLELIAAVAIMGERSVDLTDEHGAVVGSQKIGALQLRGFNALVGEVFSGDVFAIAGAAAAHTWLGQGSAEEWVTVFGGGNTKVQLGQHAVASAQAELLAKIDLLG